MASGKATPGGGPAASPPQQDAAAVRPAPGRDGRLTAGEALRRYLRDQATEFLRGAAVRGARDGGPERLMRRSARRMSGVLSVYAPLTDPAWSTPLRAELDWLAAVLGHEPHHAAHLDHLLTALHRLSPTDTLATQLPTAARHSAPPAPQPPTAARRSATAAPQPPTSAHRPGADAPQLPTPARHSTSPAPQPPTSPRRGAGIGVARAGALVERQAAQARARAHAAAWEARGSARFHAVCDAVAMAASDVPLTPAAAGPADVVVAALAAEAVRRVQDAAAALPLDRAGLPYNAEAVQASLGADLTADLQDAPWHAVRILLRRCRYAVEVPGAGAAADPALLAAAAGVLRRHHEAAECAAAVAAAARTPRIAPATAYALGVLHADQRHEVEAARFAFSRLWPAPEPAAAQGARVR